jgi:hypothetical protein
MKPARIVSGRLENFEPIVPLLKFNVPQSLQGIQTIVHCVVTEETENQTGLFYRDCKVYRSQANLDLEISSKLWQASCQMCGL